MREGTPFLLLVNSRQADRLESGRRRASRRMVLLGFGSGLLVATAAGASLLALFSSSNSQGEPKTVAMPSPAGGKPSPKDSASEAFRKKLTPEQYRITREKGTELAFTGRYWNFREVGVYKCVCCGARLFDSKHKFDSGTGWPSYSRPIEDQNIKTAVDFSLLVTRTEVQCSRCDAHLGQVVEDDTQTTGLRYTINSAALDFEPARPPAQDVAKKGD